MIQQPAPSGPTSSAVCDDAQFHREAARRLCRPGARLAVDFGCGAGDMAVALADTATEPVTVVGVDDRPDRFAATARKRPDLRFVAASFTDPVERLLDTIDGPADLVWTRNAVHHAPDPTAAVARLGRLLVPGGVLALAEGGVTLLAPDQDTAGLLARLPVVDPVDEESVALRGLLTEAGLTGVHTDTVRYAHRWPADPADLDHLVTQYRSRVDRAHDDLSEPDRARWQRLLAPDGPASLYGRGDLSYQVAATIHIGYR